MNISTKNPADEATTLLRPIMHDVYNVVYDPKFPRPDGSTFSIFQVVFAIGSSDDVEARSTVHKLFEKILALVADLESVRRSDFVTLRCRRRTQTSQSGHPFMYIEADWEGKSVAEMQKDGSYSTWANRCKRYINRWDKNDPLTRVFTQ